MEHKHIGFSEVNYDMESVKWVVLLPVRSEGTCSSALHKLVYLTVVMEAVVFFHPTCLPLKKESLLTAQ